MKSKLRFFLISALTFVLTCLTAVPAVAADYDFKVDGVYYKVISWSDLTCKVVSGDSEYTGDVVIPEKVDYGVRTFSVTKIEKSAFYYCTGLTSITIPNSVTYIGEYAFYGCTGLTSVAIPSSVTWIGNKAFEDCTGLKSVTIGLTSTDIPNSVTTIGERAFLGCEGLTELTIGNSVTKIGDDAFCRCTSLTSVFIPNSVTSISDGAFYNCSCLKAVIIEDGLSVLWMGLHSEYMYYTGIFGGCPIEIVYVGRTIDYFDSANTGLYNKNIIYSSFSSLKSLKSVTIGNSVTTIGVFAFSGCKGLTSVTIPNSVTEIGRGAFSGSGLTSVTIPSPVTKIGDNAFYGCTGLTSVTIGNSVTEIGDYAFCGCTGLTSVTIGNSVTTIGVFAFSGCEGLTSVTIPNSVTTIGNGAFNRTGLTSVTCLAKTPPIAHSATFSDNTYLWATLYVPTGTSAAYSSVDGWKNFLIKEIDVPDAIKDITLDQNGKTTIFDLQGHRIAQPKKGINIINGKKVLVK